MKVLYGNNRGTEPAWDAYWKLVVITQWILSTGEDSVILLDLTQTRGFEQTENISTRRSTIQMIPEDINGTVLGIYTF